MTQRSTRQGRRRVLADTKSVTFAALAADVDRQRALADHQGVTDSECLRGLLHAVLAAPEVVARATAALWQFEAERILDAEGTLTEGEDPVSRAAEGLVALYADIVQGPLPEVVRQRPATPVAPADLRDRAERIARARAEIRERVGLSSDPEPEVALGRLLDATLRSRTGS
jgi:hypothetical protein